MLPNTAKIQTFYNFCDTHFYYYFFKQTHLTIIVIFRPSTTDDPILSLLSQSDLISFSKTCKYVRESVLSFYQRAFRVELVLKRYFEPDEIIKFRDLQETTG
jgi:hypothetical protein